MVDSPDMSLCDHSIFGQQKIGLQGCTFYSDEEVPEVVTEWMSNVEVKSAFTQFIILSLYEVNV